LKVTEKQEILDFLKENKDFFLKNFGIIKIGIFGSYARGVSRPKKSLQLMLKFCY